MRNTSIDVSKYKGIIFDMDGVLWAGSRAIPGAAKTIKKLAGRGLEMSYVSNSAGRSREDCYKKAIGMNFLLDRERIIIASREVSKYLAQQLNPEALVYVIGSSGLREEVKNAGLKIKEYKDEDIIKIVETKVDAVLVGWDGDINSRKLTIALNLIRNGALFAAVNKDATTPGSNYLKPATGSIVAAVEKMVNRRPDIMVGKPAVYLIEKALAEMGLQAEEVLIVGDTLDTDILAGNKVGLDTALVLSGNTGEDDIVEIETERKLMRPDHIINSIVELL
ncbi:MAG: HAD-IIA family hydrolase [Bacillota bacterium]